jgi:hypothetical protein
MEEFCCEVTEDINNKSNTFFETVRSRTEHKEENEVCAKAGGLSVVTTTLIVTGVLLVCAIGGGIVLVKVVKRRRKKSKRPEYCGVYAPRASYISVQSYE